MRVCLMIEGQEGVTWPQWVALAEAAEEAGLEGLFRSDHYRSIGHARERKRILDDAARDAGREPLRFSMMIGCVAGRDQDDLRHRLAAFRDVTGNESPPLAGTVDELVDRLRAYEEAGVERVMLQHLVHEDVEMVHVLGELAARLR